MFLPLELTLRPSRIYPPVLILAHGLALSGLWLAALPVAVQALMTAALLAGAIWLWREGSNSPRALRVSQSGQIEVLEGEEWWTAEIRRQPVVLPGFVSLVLHDKAGRARRLILWPDSTEADGFRKLRVWLKWGRLTG